MSQVKFKAQYKSKPVEVMGGYDRPLKDFYLTVFDESEDAEEETVWSTLSHPSQVDLKSTLRLRTQLMEMGIEAPEGFWERVELKEANVNHVFKNGAWVRWDM